MWWHFYPTDCKIRPGLLLRQFFAYFLFSTQSEVYSTRPIGVASRGPGWNDDLHWKWGGLLIIIIFINAVIMAVINTTDIVNCDQTQTQTHHHHPCRHHH